MSTHQSKVRVGPLDVDFAGVWSWALLGPTEFADSSDYLSVLSRIAQSGAQQRVGLRPRRDRRTWDFDPQFGASVLATNIDLDPLDVENTMNQLISLRVEEPIVVGNLQGYTVFGYDHGLGDAHLMVELIAAFTRAGEHLPTGFIPPMPQSYIDKPLAALARSVLASGPATVGRDVFHGLKLRRMLHQSDVADAAPDITSDTSPLSRPPNYATVFVRSRPGFLESVRAVRDEYYEGSSVAALTFVGLRRALAKFGIVLTDTTSVLADLRRYMRPEQGTLANLATVVRICTPEEQTVDQFASSLGEAVASSYPAARMLAGVVLRPLRRRFTAAPAAQDGHSHRKVELVISDVSRLPALKKLRFRDDSTHPIFCAAGFPGGRNHLTVGLIPVGDEFQATATFFPDVVAAEQVRVALQHALTAESYL